MPGLAPYRLQTVLALHDEKPSAVAEYRVALQGGGAACWAGTINLLSHDTRRRVGPVLVCHQTGKGLWLAVRDLHLTADGTVAASSLPPSPKYVDRSLSEQLRLSQRETPFRR
jgi:hypothetical protein